MPMPLANTSTGIGYSKFMEKEKKEDGVQSQRSNIPNIYLYMSM